VFKHSFEAISSNFVVRHHQVYILSFKFMVNANNPSAEFTEHQRNVFCVFSGRGVTDLRNHLNHLDTNSPYVAGDDDDDHTMTGMAGTTALLNATGLNVGDDEDADGDEELEDGDGGVDGGVSFGQT